MDIGSLSYRWPDSSEYRVVIKIKENAIANVAEFGVRRKNEALDKDSNQ